MAADRNFWIGEQTRLSGLCPTCQRGHYAVVADSFHTRLDANSREMQDGHDDWDVEWLRWRFSGLLGCSNAACQETAAVAGIKRVEENQIDWDELVRTDRYEITSFTPSPLPFPLRDEYPEDVSALLRLAADIYWPDPEAAANKIRQAVEALLTHRRIPRTVLGGDRKRHRLPLHQRIVRFEEADRETAQLLFAVKWLGNAGSHVGGLAREDVLIGFDMLEHVLERLYVRAGPRLLARAARIIRRRGPA